MRLGIASAAIAGCLIVILVLLDAFHTIVLARRTGQSFRITRLFYTLSWTPFAAMARRVKSGRRREALLGAYGPLSLLLLFGLWAICLIVGFGLLQWAIGLRTARNTPGFIDDLYFSATTLFTLGTGDPVNLSSRFVAVAEGGTGFMLLGLVIGYLPVFYQAFSQREVQISLLDARAGSPPSAVDLLRLDVSNPGRVERYFEHAEKWASEILESHISFPMLVWFRSHHPNQSWLSALTVLLDSASVVSICADGDLRVQAGLTLAMGTHALADICRTLHLNVAQPSQRRLSSTDLGNIREAIANRKALDSGKLSGETLCAAARMYEGQAQSLSSYLLMGVPSWSPHDQSRENWRSAQNPQKEDVFAVSDPFRS